MKLDFRIDWGYIFLYSRRHYHPVYRWDGRLECAGGEILCCSRLEYPVLWFGPGHSAREIPLDGPEWRNSTKRGFAGVRCVAEVTPASRFRLVTLSGTFEFSAQEILESGRLVFHVGPKYSHCQVLVTRKDFLWFRPLPRPGQLVWEAADLPLPQHHYSRMPVAWLAPGATLEFDADLPASRHEYFRALLHLVALAAPASFPADGEKPVRGDFILAISCDGREAARAGHYFREHDFHMQLAEDVWCEFPYQPGRRRIALTNLHPDLALALSRVTIEIKGYDHLQLSLPAWGLAGEALTGAVFALRADRAALAWPGGGAELEVRPGWNEFAFRIDESGTELPVTAGGKRATVGAIYDLSDETPPVLVGYDMTTVPHDDHGDMDWLLDYTARTRLGNFVVFRNFRPGPVPPELLRRWGEFCRRRHIRVEAATDFIDGALAEAAGESMHSAGLHEYPGAVYARDPQPPYASEDMKEAYEKYLAYLKIEVDKVHQAGMRAAFGDASGGHRHCYLAGADFIRTETMVPHTQHLCALARPAAEALGSGEWGVHIAIQHAVQPYLESHLGLYFLSLFQPWMMGASVIYEEDCLFNMFKEERQTWDDALTKGKRDMTRDFFRFVRTHPRSAGPRRRIAFLEGRYAAPFNGFICGSEQDPHYPVWGLFGSDDPAWGHGQPEKCRQLLDVLMPGASVHPLRQHFDKRRFFFSGTPYGDFDEIPVEAGGEYFQRYELLLHLGWNTMIAEDYAKLRQFVASGGVLFTGLPQFSTHLRRDFLRDFADLALWNGGDLSEFAGVRVLGPGDLYSGQWNAAGREEFRDMELSGLPSDNPGEDGPCRLAEVELAGAEPVAWDAASGKPLVVRRRYGEGAVYLLTAWAYPGHEQLQPLAASWIDRLARRHRGGCYIEDASREVFWNVREGDGHRVLMLLNSDWTAAGNRKAVTVVAPHWRIGVEVTERRPVILTVFEFGLLETPPEIHAEVLQAGPGEAELKLHGTGSARLTFRRPDGSCETLKIDFSGRVSAPLKIVRK